jgi:uncharacterized protein (DUF362 family)
MIVMKEVRNSNDMRELLEEAGVTPSDHYIVKPNWFFHSKGFYADAKTLRLLLECMDKVTIVEAHTYMRNDGTRKITQDNAKGNWNWIKDQDDKFLKESGLSQLFQEYGVEYINVTEEVWSNRIANPQKIKKLVEERFPPVEKSELYEQIPQRLYDLRGSKLISFAKVKGANPDWISGALKNMFGLIIEPDRHGWHGKKDRILAHSIVDVNKVYSSLFKTVGLIEAIYTAVHFRRETYPLPWGGGYDLTENLGLAVYGDNLTFLDAYVCTLFKIDPNNINYLQLAAKVFGEWPQEKLEEASKKQIIAL